ncbi:MAG: RluA family pseudouridine synthase [Candidatus Omnitrophica bacterium]|nr:RluA family pseudouridine synthase [Candidatus Omnitrophota bacterium]
MVDNSPKINIIYTDRDFLVLEKPAGILVHHTKHQKKNTLVDWLVKKFPEIKKVGEKGRYGIVHRLDRQVSGLMVIAKNQAMYKSLKSQFKYRRVEKEYTVLIYGKVNEKGVIKKPIGRTKSNKLAVIESDRDAKFKKQAITRYKVIKRFKNYTLLRVNILTGRTHQIRLHLKSIGSPIVGDRKSKDFDLNRIFLHASFLGFHDLDEKWHEFESNLPNKLKNILNKIK